MAHSLPARLPRSGKLPVLNLLTGQKKSAFSLEGRLVAPIHVKCGIAEVHVGALGRAKFHANRCPGWERGPKMAKKSLFGKESPRRGEPFDRFLHLLGAFIRQTTLY